MMNDQAVGGGISRPGEENENPISWEPSRVFIKYASVVLLAGSIAFVMLVRLVAPDQTARYIGPVASALVAVTAWFFLSRGKSQAAAAVLGFGGWITITAILVFNGGVRTPIAIAYPTGIILIGWLFGSRAALPVAFLTVVAIISFVLAESWGFLPKQPPTPAVMYGVVQTLVIVLSTVLIVFLVRAYRKRLDEVGKLGSGLAQRTAEVQARESDLNRAQAVAHVGSWVYDLGTDTMQLSAETCRVFGLPAGTTGSHNTYLSRVHPEDRSAVDAAWQAALEGGQPFDNEHRIMVGKTIRWVRQIAEQEFGADGTPLRSVGTTQDITDRKETEKKLHALLAEKEVLMREIHHRVKNSLQMMSALLELQSGYVQDEKVRAYFTNSQQRIQSMAMIHAQLYQNQDMAHIDFAAYVQSLVDALRGQYGERTAQVDIRIDVQACTLPVDTAVPLGLVINELVSNAMKHAFPQGRSGELRITLQASDEGEVVLEVADNGVGMSAEPDLQGGKGFGMRVLRLMVEEQLHGKLSIESDHGTRVVCETGGQE